MGCVFTSIKVCFSTLISAIERISLCTVCAILTCSLCFTVLMILSVGIGIGYHYCYVQTTLNKIEQETDMSVNSTNTGSTTMIAALITIASAIRPKKQKYKYLYKNTKNNKNNNKSEKSTNNNENKNHNPQRPHDDPAWPTHGDPHEHTPETLQDATHSHDDLSQLPHHGSPSTPQGDAHGHALGAIRPKKHKYKYLYKNTKNSKNKNQNEKSTNNTENKNHNPQRPHDDPTWPTHGDTHGHTPGTPQTDFPQLLPHGSPSTPQGDTHGHTLGALQEATTPYTFDGLSQFSHNGSPWTSQGLKNRKGLAGTTTAQNGRSTLQSTQNGLSQRPHVSLSRLSLSSHYGSLFWPRHSSLSRLSYTSSPWPFYDVLFRRPHDNLSRPPHVELSRSPYDGLFQSPQDSFYQPPHGDRSRPLYKGLSRSRHDGFFEPSQDSISRPSSQPSLLLHGHKPDPPSDATSQPSYGKTLTISPIRTWHPDVKHILRADYDPKQRMNLSHPSETFPGSLYNFSIGVSNGSFHGPSYEHLHDKVHQPTHSSNSQFSHTFPPGLSHGDLSQLPYDWLTRPPYIRPPWHLHGDSLGHTRGTHTDATLRTTHSSPSLTASVTWAWLRGASQTVHADWDYKHELNLSRSSGIHPGGFENLSVGLQLLNTSSHSVLNINYDGVHRLTHSGHHRPFHISPSWLPYDGLLRPPQESLSSATLTATHSTTINPLPSRTRFRGATYTVPANWSDKQEINFSRPSETHHEGLVSFFEESTHLPPHYEYSRPMAYGSHPRPSHTSFSQPANSNMLTFAVATTCTCTTESTFGTTTTGPPTMTTPTTTNMITHVSTTTTSSTIEPTRITRTVTLSKVTTTPTLATATTTTSTTEFTIATTTTIPITTNTPTLTAATTTTSTTETTITTTTIRPTTTTEPTLTAATTTTSTTETTFATTTAIILTTTITTTPVAATTTTSTTEPTFDTTTTTISITRSTLDTTTATPTPTLKTNPTLTTTPSIPTATTDLTVSRTPAISTTRIKTTHATTTTTTMTMPDFVTITTTTSTIEPTLVTRTMTRSTAITIPTTTTTPKITITTSTFDTTTTATSTTKPTIATTTTIPTTKMEPTVTTITTIPTRTITRTLDTPTTTTSSSESILDTTTTTTSTTENTLTITTTTTEPTATTTTTTPITTFIPTHTTDTTTTSTTESTLATITTATSTTNPTVTIKTIMPTTTTLTTNVAASITILTTEPSVTTTTTIPTTSTTVPTVTSVRTIKLTIEPIVTKTMTMPTTTITRTAATTTSKTETTFATTTTIIPTITTATTLPAEIIKPTVTTPTTLPTTTGTTTVTVATTTTPTTEPTSGAATTTTSTLEPTIAEATTTTSTTGPTLDTTTITTIPTTTTTTTLSAVITESTITTTTTKPTTTATTTVAAATTTTSILEPTLSEATTTTSSKNPTSAAATTTTTTLEPTLAEESTTASTTEPTSAPATTKTRSTTDPTVTIAFISSSTIEPIVTRTTTTLTTTTAPTFDTATTTTSTTESTVFTTIISTQTTTPTFTTTTSLPSIKAITATAMTRPTATTALTLATITTNTYPIPTITNTLTPTPTRPTIDTTTMITPTTTVMPTTTTFITITTTPTTTIPTHTTTTIITGRTTTISTTKTTPTTTTPPATTTTPTTTTPPTTATMTTAKTTTTPPPTRTTTNTSLTTKPTRTAGTQPRRSSPPSWHYVYFSRESSTRANTTQKYIGTKIPDAHHNMSPGFDYKPLNFSFQTGMPLYDPFRPPQSRLQFQGGPPRPHQRISPRPPYRFSTQTPAWWPTPAHPGQLSLRFSRPHFGHPPHLPFGETTTTPVETKGTRPRRPPNWQDHYSSSKSITKTTANNGTWFTGSTHNMPPGFDYKQAKKFSIRPGVPLDALISTPTSISHWSFPSGVHGWPPYDFPAYGPPYDNPFRPSHSRPPETHDGPLQPPHGVFRPSHGLSPLTPGRWPTPIHPGQPSFTPSWRHFGGPLYSPFGETATTTSTTTKRTRPRRPSPPSWQYFAEPEFKTTTPKTKRTRLRGPLAPGWHYDYASNESTTKTATNTGIRMTDSPHNLAPGFDYKQAINFSFQTGMPLDPFRPPHARLTQGGPPWPPHGVSSRPPHEQPLQVRDHLSPARWPIPAHPGLPYPLSSRPHFSGPSYFPFGETTTIPVKTKRTRPRRPSLPSWQYSAKPEFKTTISKTKRTRPQRPLARGWHYDYSSSESTTKTTTSTGTWITGSPNNLPSGLDYKQAKNFSFQPLDALILAPNGTPPHLKSSWSDHGLPDDHPAYGPPYYDPFRPHHARPPELQRGLPQSLNGMSPHPPHELSPLTLARRPTSTYPGRESFLPSRFYFGGSPHPPFGEAMTTTSTTAKRTRPRRPLPPGWHYDYSSVESTTKSTTTLRYTGTWVPDAPHNLPLDFYYKGSSWGAHGTPYGHSAYGRPYDDSFRPPHGRLPEVQDGPPRSPYGIYPRPPHGHSPLTPAQSPAPAHPEQPSHSPSQPHFSETTTTTPTKTKRTRPRRPLPPNWHYDYFSTESTTKTTTTPRYTLTRISGAPHNMAVGFDYQQATNFSFQPGMPLDALIFAHTVNPANWDAPQDAHGAPPEHHAYGRIYNNVFRPLHAPPSGLYDGPPRRPLPPGWHDYYSSTTKATTTQQYTETWIPGTPHNMSPDYPYDFNFQSGTPHDALFFAPSGIPSYQGSAWGAQGSAYDQLAYGPHEELFRPPHVRPPDINDGPPRSPHNFSPKPLHELSPLTFTAWPTPAHQEQPSLSPSRFPLGHPPYPHYGPFPSPYVPLQPPFGGKGYLPFSPIMQQKFQINTPMAIIDYERGNDRYYVYANITTSTTTRTVSDVFSMYYALLQQHTNDAPPWNVNQGYY